VRKKNLCLRPTAALCQTAKPRAIVERAVPDMLGGRLHFWL
jgi:hypothetical protein